MSYTLAWILKCLKLYPSISLIDDSAAATQPLSRSARVADAATQPLCQSGWSSHSATLPEWLTQPLSYSARVAGAATQTLSHSARDSNNTNMLHMLGGDPWDGMAISGRGCWSWHTKSHLMASFWSRAHLCALSPETEAQ